MRVGDVMTRSVITTTPRVPVRDAAAVLAGRGITALPVVDEQDRLVGLLTEADVVRGRIPPDPRRRACRGSRAGTSAPATVGEVMSGSPVTADPGTDTVDLARMMIDRGLRSVPVVDGGRVVGIVTRRELRRTIAGDDSLIAADVRKRLAAYGGSARWTVHAQQGSVTITDRYPDPADHHVALMLARSVPGVVNAHVMHATAGHD